MPDSRAHRTLSKPLSSDPAFSLAWLIHPAPTQQFFASYWETQTLVVKRNQPHYYDSLLTLDAVDRALTTLDRKYPEVVLKNANLPVSENDYTLKDGSLDVARVYQLFQEGSTITLAFLDTVLPELNSFCRSLERELSFPMQANIYLTPPAGQGAKPHYDTHDVFVLQVSGSKQWTIYETPVELPLASQDFDSAIHPIGASTLEFELEAGDMAYIPRGAAHDARSTDMTSLHVTAGVLRYTWADLILEAVAGAALTDPAFRRSLPPGFARTDFDRSQAFEMFRELLRRVPAQANFDAALDRFVDEFIAACPPQLRGQMSQIERLDGLTVGSIVGARPNSIFRLSSDAQNAYVDCYGRRITFPSGAAEAVEFALTTQQFAVRDLPGELDDSGKLTLVRRLIREGLMMALPPSHNGQTRSESIADSSAAIESGMEAGSGASRIR